MAWWITDGVLQRAEEAPADNSIRTNISGKGDVVIPEGVTVIGRGAFSFWNYIDRVTIPTGVKRIEQSAFSNCEFLTKVTFPEGLELIENEAFRGCKSLTDIAVPGSVKSIENRAFYGCRSLTNVTLSEGTEFIGEFAFACCSSLTGIKIPGSTAHIGRGAFWICSNLEDVILSEGIAFIDAQVFEGCRNLKKITIPDSVAYIGWNAFASGAKHRKINLPEGMISVEESFYQTKVPMISDAVLVRIGKDAGRLLAISCAISLKEVVAPVRQKLCIGFVLNRDRYSEELQSEYIAYIKKNAAKLIGQAFDYPELLQFMCREKLIAAKNIDEFMQEALKRGDVELTAVILDYQNSVLTMKAVGKAREKKEKLQEKQDETIMDRMIARADHVGIDGLNFVVTGSLQNFAKRDDLKAYIAERGGKLLSAMSAKTDYLITNDTDSGSAKNLKAAQLGIVVITEDEFMKMAEKKQA